MLGCGFVADFYMSSAQYHPDLEIISVYDRNSERLNSFAKYYGLDSYNSLSELLSDPKIGLVLNLTNPREHYFLTKECLMSGKHVYSEKPLAMDYRQARELVLLANEKHLFLGSAPSSVLSNTAQTIWKALSEDIIGPVRLVYANFDAGMTHKYKPWNWKSVSGAPWPAKDEFEVGCTYEHAGYFLTWLAAYFGPAKKVSAFSSCQLPEKDIPLDFITPDFACGCIEYDNGIIARVTTSIVAPLDKSLTIIGDDGIIYTKDMRDDLSPVYIRKVPASRIESALEYRMNHWMNKFERIANRLPWSWGNKWHINKRYPYAMKPESRNSGKYKPVDFCSGPAEMLKAIMGNRACMLSADLALHINELIEVLQHPDRYNGSKILETTFEPLMPLEWNNN